MSPGSPVHLVLARNETLSAADHQSHRYYPFAVPPGCQALHIAVRYAPKVLPAEQAAPLIHAAVDRQQQALAEHVPDHDLVDAWRQATDVSISQRRLQNLLTISLDDADGRYRGAGHRHAPDQALVLSPAAASPGLIAGPLPAGAWRLVLSVHTLVSSACSVSIQIGAVTATSPPASSRTSA